MNLLFEAQREKPPVTALVFPVMSTGMEAQADVAALADEALRANERVAVEQARRAKEEEMKRSLEQGREEGLAEGERRRREGLEVERSAVGHLCTSFAKERKQYFAEVEGEVVKLALAIAARVLQRESALDPALLKGVVNVALAKLGDGKGAVLRMNPTEQDSWAAEMKHAGIEVAVDASLEPGELRLEAAGGVAELGIAAQLVEIERGFFDLLARRPV